MATLLLHITKQSILERGDFDSGSLNLFDRLRKVFCGLVDDSKVMAKDYTQEWPPTQFFLFPYLLRSGAINNSRTAVLTTPRANENK